MIKRLFLAGLMVHCGPQSGGTTNAHCKHSTVSLCRLTGTSTVTDQHLLRTDRDIPDPLFSGLLNKPSLPTGHSLFKLERKACILRCLIDQMRCFMNGFRKGKDQIIGKVVTPRSLKSNVEYDMSKMTSFAHPGAVASCVRSKGWGQTVPHRLAHLSAHPKLCNTCSTRL